MKSILVNGVVVGEVEATGDLERDARVARDFLDERGLLKEWSPAGEIFGAATAFANTSAHLYENGLTKKPTKGSSIVPFVVKDRKSVV